MLLVPLLACCFALVMSVPVVSYAQQIFIITNSNLSYSNLFYLYEFVLNSVSTFYIININLLLEFFSEIYIQSS